MYRNDWEQFKGEIKKINRHSAYLEELKIGRLIEIEEFLLNESENRQHHIDNQINTIYIRSAPNNKMAEKSYPELLEHFKFNLIQGGLRLSEIESSLLLVRQKLNEIPSQNSIENLPEIVGRVFMKNGFDVFNYLDKHYLTYNQNPGIKYSILYFYLLEERHLIRPNKSTYKEFVRSYCNKKLKGQRFSRLTETNSYEFSQFNESLPDLNHLYSIFLETSKS